MVFSSPVADYRCARITAIRIATRVQLEECDALLTGSTDNALEDDDNRRTAAAQLEAANSWNESTADRRTPESNIPFVALADARALRPHDSLRVESADQPTLRGREGQCTIDIGQGCIRATDVVGPPRWRGDPAPEVLSALFRGGGAS